VIYVQSSGQAHGLGIITSSGNVINASLVDYAAAPAWSPNGTKIAFFGEPDINKLGGIYTEGEGIWMIDVQSNNPTYLFKTNHVKNLAWSPDGAKLAFEYGPPDRFHEIIVINPANGQKINNFPGEQPAWSPDSQKLTIKACLPSCGLWQVNLDGSNGQQLTFHDSDSYPSWSRNGDLAFSSQQAGNSEIYLLRPGSDPPQRLTNRTGTDTTPVFSPDGLEIYLRTNAFGNWQITAITLDGGNERPIKEDVGPSDEWGLARPAVH
jgi:Tol biopolymer transport system component